MLRIILALAVLALLALATASCEDEGVSGPRWRIVLEPQADIEASDLDEALDGVQEVIRRRIEITGAIRSTVERTGQNQIVVELAGFTPDEATVGTIGLTALLQFCQPIIDNAGNVAILEQGVVVYESLTCEPMRDAGGNIAVEATEDFDGNIVEPGEVEFVPWFDDFSPQASSNPLNRQLVWEPATAEIDGQVLTLDGTYLSPDTFVTFSATIFGNQPSLVFSWRGDGPDISEAVTTRLAERSYPLSPWLDGEPILNSNGLIIAPHVQTVIISGGQITGLDVETAEELSTILNTGAFPVPMRIVDAQEVIE